jgi:hypothetical protein
MANGMANGIAIFHQPCIISLVSENDTNCRFRTEHKSLTRRYYELAVNNGCE